MKKYTLQFILAFASILVMACSDPEKVEETEPIDEMEEEIVEEMSEASDTTANNEGDQKEGEITFLALGDSYTIGESVDEKLRWPVQLADAGMDSGFNVRSPKIIARTGWTTDELKAAIEAEALGDTTFNYVSLLIGVNNQFRGYPFSQYEREFVELLDQAIAFAGGSTANVFVVSIPDYGVTPFGKTRDPEKIARELDQYNNYAESVCKGKGIEYFYITEISRDADTDPSLVASDNLHPSGKMYTLWVELIAPWFVDKLNQ